jgi:hypothetical protein
MKTLSLKMLLVAALVVSPVVMADEPAAATPATTTEVKAVDATPAAEAPKADAATPAVKGKEAAEGYFTRAKNAVTTTGAAVAAVPGDLYAWVTESKTNAVLATVVTYLAAKEAYAYLTAPAKAKAVKATTANN